MHEPTVPLPLSIHPIRQWKQKNAKGTLSYILLIHPITAHHSSPSRASTAWSGSSSRSCSGTSASPPPSTPSPTSPSAPYTRRPVYPRLCFLGGLDLFLLVVGLVFVWTCFRCGGSPRCVWGATSTIHLLITKPTTPPTHHHRRTSAGATTSSSPSSGGSATSHHHHRRRQQHQHHHTAPAAACPRPGPTKFRRGRGGWRTT